MAPAASIPAANLPILPLAKGTVLYPGSVLRVPVPPSRSDVPALLSTVYTRASKSQLRVDQVPIICVPLSSPLVTRRNQNLFEENPNKYNELLEANAKNVKKERLYGYGVQAKINAIQGQSDAEFSLVVQGIARVIIEKVTQDQPFFEAKIVPHVDQIGADELANTTFRELFGKLKSCSRDLVAYLRVSAFLVASGSQGLNPLLSRRLEQFIASKHLNEAGALADFMMNVVEATYEEKLEILSAIDVAVRMEKVIALIEKQVSDIKSNIKITTVTSTSIPIRIDPDDADKMPRGKSRRRALPVGGQAFNVGSLFGAGGNNNSEKEDSDEPDELQELENRLEAAKLTPEADKVAQRELKRLKQMVPAQAEYQVVRTYLETLAEIPWTAITDDPIDAGSLERARKQLDEDHYGIDKVKKRLLSYLTIVRLMQNANKVIDAQVKEAEQETTALESTKKDSTPKDTPADGDLEEKIRESGLKVQMLRGKLRTERAPILLLIGPPGVGKTSIARSIATALGRKFHRISLGGVRDEAEIRGHRRTYVAAMPGLIVQGLRKVGVANPVFLLDEIDKLGMANHNGDPSAAMLEVLDPEQNHNFSDHYVGTPIDLSKILFIATANSLDTIPGPLLDRMETLEFSGYTSLEKQHIAMRHLVPKQIRVNGLAENQIRFNDQVVSKIIESYTREAGVRNLEREIGSVCRAKAVEYVEAGDSGKPDSFRADVTVEDLESILGIERFEDEIAETKSQPGIVTGLVAYSTGGNGGILFIEVLDMPGDGSVELTGNLGEVLKESVKVARSWVRNHAYELGLTQNPTENIMKNRSLHVHCPSGAVPKDGPSSGMAQAIALISLLSGRPVPATMAMTGEFQLSGHVKRVGGIKEKVIGAYRAGVKTVMLPAQNEKDTREVPQEVRDGLKIIYVGHIWEAIRQIWPEVTWPVSGENGRDGSERPAQSRL